VGLATILNMALVTGTTQSVSHFVAGSSEGVQEAIKQTTLKIQAVLAGTLFITFMIFTPQIAALLNDTQLTNYLRIAAVIFFCYAFYSVFIGYLNGKKGFKAQALFDISYSSTKFICILGLAYLGFNALGAISGFSLSSAIILMAAVFIIGFKKTDQIFSWKKIIRYELAIIGLAFLINLMMNLDLLMLKALTSIEESNLAAGYYTSALTIARIPYQLLMGLNLALFPFIASHSKEGNREEVGNHIRKGIKLYFGLLLIAAVGISSSPEATIGLIYPIEYTEGGKPLFLLAFGYLFFALWVFIATIMTASGHPRQALLFGTITVGVQYVSLLFLIPKFGPVGASLGSLCAWAVGVGGGTIWMATHFRRCLPIRSLILMGVAGLLCYGLSIYWPAEKVVSPD